MPLGSLMILSLILNAAHIGSQLNDPGSFLPASEGLLFPGTKFGVWDVSLTGTPYGPKNGPLPSVKGSEVQIFW